MGPHSDEPGEEPGPSSTFCKCKKLDSNIGIKKYLKNIANTSSWFDKKAVVLVHPFAIGNPSKTSDKFKPAPSLAVLWSSD